MNDFIKFFQDLFGQYSLVTDSSGLISDGLAGVDFPFVLRALVFVIVIYSLFRLCSFE